MAAAKGFSHKAMEANGDPNKVAMDKSGAKNTAMDTVIADCHVPLLVI
jgi:putative transposase